MVFVGMGCSEFQAMQQKIHRIAITKLGALCKCAVTESGPLTKYGILYKTASQYEQELNSKLGIFIFIKCNFKNQNAGQVIPS